MAQFDGARTIAIAESESRVIRAVDQDIALLEPDVAPLITILTLTEKMRQGVGSTKVEWGEAQYVEDWITLTAAALVGDTALTVDDAYKVNVGDVIIVPKAVSSSAAPEQLRVTARTDATHIAVTRGFAGSTAAAIAINTPMRICGSAAAENAPRGTAKNTPKVTLYNYMRTFRTSTEMSRSMIQSSVYGAPLGDWPEELRNKLVEHKKEMNAASIWGKKGKTTDAEGREIRLCDGLNSVVTTNVMDAGGALTETAFDNYLQMAFRFGSRRKVGVFAPIIMRAVHSWAKNKLHIQQGATEYGLNFTRYISSFGELMLLNDWELETVGGGGFGFAGWGFVIDPEVVSYRYLKGNGGALGSSDTKLIELPPEKNLAQDGAYAEYITEACPVFKQEQRHAKIFNVTSFAA